MPSWMVNPRAVLAFFCGGWRVANPDDDSFQYLVEEPFVSEEEALYFQIPSLRQAVTILITGVRVTTQSVRIGNETETSTLKTDNSRYLTRKIHSCPLKACDGQDGRSLSNGEHRISRCNFASGIKPTPILGFACAPMGRRFTYHGDVILLLERLSSGRCIWQHFNLNAISKFELTIEF